MEFPMPFLNEDSPFFVSGTLLVAVLAVAIFFLGAPLVGAVLIFAGVGVAAGYLLNRFDQHYGSGPSHLLTLTAVLIGLGVAVCWGIPGAAIAACASVTSAGLMAGFEIRSRYDVW